MIQAPDTTRSRLLAAAERLLAEQGVDGASLREITRVAGARNTSALQYHFGDRAGLVDAVLAKHAPGVEAARNALLDAYEAAGEDDVRTLAAALVRPFAAKLADADGGPAYLQIVADLVQRPQPILEPLATERVGSSMYRWRELIAPLLEPEALRLHRRFMAIRLAAIELGIRARTAPHTDDRLFTSQLVDLVTGLLAAHSSPETLRLARERAAR